MQIYSINKVTRHILPNGLGQLYLGWEFHVKENAKYGVGFKFSTALFKQSVRILKPENEGWKEMISVDNMTSLETSFIWEFDNDTWFVYVEHENPKVSNDQLRLGTPDNIQYPSHGNELVLFYTIPKSKESSHISIVWLPNGTW